MDDSVKCKPTTADWNSLIGLRFDEYWVKFESQYAACQSALNVEGIHELRVAIQRFLALLDLLEDLDFSSRIRDLRKSLKRLRDKFDQLRDLQILMAELTDEPGLNSSEDPFFLFLKNKSTILMQKLQPFFTIERLQKILSKINAIRDDYYFGKKKVRKTCRKLTQNIDKVYKTAVTRRKELDKSNPSTFHQLRIALRNLRYKLEVIKPLLDNYPDENMQQMKEKQGKLGAVQNHLVMLGLIDKFAKENPDINVDHHRAYLERGLTAAIEQVPWEMTLEPWWRASAKKDFPWATDDIEKADS
jgi:CHAD domain-containing protein